MKKILLPIVTILLFSSNSSFAQYKLYDQLSCAFYCATNLQADGGASFASMSNDQNDPGSNGFKPGFILGISTNTRLSPLFSFNPGLAYEQKGNNYEYSYEYEEYEYEPDIGSKNPATNARIDPGTTIQETKGANSLERKTTLSYLTVPLILGISPIEEARDFSIVTGLNPAILLSHKTNIDSFGSESSESGTDNLRSFDLGVLAGFRYKTPYNIAVSAIYDHGLINTSNVENGGKFYNRTIKLVFSYIFNYNPFVKKPKANN